MKIIILLLVIATLMVSCDSIIDEEASRNDPRGKLYCLEVLQEMYPDLHFEFEQSAQRGALGCTIRFPNGAYMDANEYLLDRWICDD